MVEHELECLQLFQSGILDRCLGCSFSKDRTLRTLGKRGRLTRGILPCLPHTMKSLRGNHKAAFCLSSRAASKGLTTLAKGAMEGELYRQS